jgi:hypothetical protein
MPQRSRTIQNLVEQSAKAIEGMSLPRPRGTLSGHAAGLPFETLVNDEITARFPGQSYRHFEALNLELTRKAEQSRNPSAFVPPTSTLFGPPDLHYLIARGTVATKAWRTSKLFAEKQNDTAETVIFASQKRDFNEGVTTLVDVKTQNLDFKAQPPNIISAFKIAKVCELVLNGGLTPSFDILYTAVKFRPSGTAAGGGLLTCEGTRTISLLDVPVEELYINWTAATQIQFHPFEVSQGFNGTTTEWMRAFLHHYCDKQDNRIQKQLEQVREFRLAAGR